MTLNGKVSLITGAGYGVGRAIALGLARAGSDLILAGRSTDQLVETSKRIQSLGKKAFVSTTDIGQFDQVESMAKLVREKYGRLDVLVNNAFGHIGEDKGKSLRDVLPQELADFAQSSIVGTWFVVRELAPLLRLHNGRAVFVVADWGIPQHNVFLATPPGAKTRLGSEAFASAKHAISGFVNALERMIGVPASAIYPGIIASARPSKSTDSETAYFDLDDPIEMIEAEECYVGGWAIPLVDIVESVLFALRTHCSVKGIMLKPATPDYDGLHV